jgi:MinD superfamily P-loop ATPase
MEWLETWLIDCDVEEPNAGLFIHPHLGDQKPVLRNFPRINPDRCRGCGQCAQVCSYHAIAIISGKAIIFKDLCHACGSCTLNCPEQAITEVKEQVGVLHKGQNHSLLFAQGCLEIGYSSPVPVIRDLKTWTISDSVNPLYILDASPGTTCPVVEALCGAHFALLVTEPTPFGLHDLQLVTRLAKDDLQIPCGVVLNKCGGMDSMIEDYCHGQDIPILMRLPLSRRIAEICSRGQLIIDQISHFETLFNDCFDAIQQLIKQGRTKCIR